MGATFGMLKRTPGDLPPDGHTAYVALRPANEVIPAAVSTRLDPGVDAAMDSDMLFTDRFGAKTLVTAYSNFWFDNPALRSVTENATRDVTIQLPRLGSAQKCILDSHSDRNLASLVDRVAG